jgi:hypothetical protein
MVYQRRQIVSESEKNRILGLYNRPLISESIVITEWLSPDEKFCIFLDDLIDIENKVKIGNIWENFDHFKFFLKHSFEVATNVSQDIKESVLTSLDSFLITESNQNMSGLKPYVKELLAEEGFFSDVADWAKEKADNAVQKTMDFKDKSWAGLKSLYKNISDGEWSKAFALIKKGILYVARTIRAALYNPIGIVLDAILIATGVGKAAQFVIWSIVVGLDIYELISGDYEDKETSLPVRLLFLGLDIVGLVFAGGLAKTGKVIVQAALRKFGSSAAGLAKALKISKPLQGIVQKMLNAMNGAKGLISKALSTLKVSSPKIYNFISKPLSAIGTFTSKIVEMLGSALKGTVNTVLKPGNMIKSALGGGRVGSGARAGFNSSVVVAGLGGYFQGQKRKMEKEIEQGLNNKDVDSEYNYEDL